MNFYDLICLIPQGTLIRIFDQHINSLYIGRVSSLDSDVFENFVTYTKLFTRGRVTDIYVDDSALVIVVYLPY